LAAVRYITEEQQAPAAGRDFPFSHRYRSLEMLHAFWALGEHGSLGGQCSEQYPDHLKSFILLNLKISRRFLGKLEGVN
jgi:hypothetical protein